MRSACSWPLRRGVDLLRLVVCSTLVSTLVSTPLLAQERAPIAVEAPSVEAPVTVEAPRPKAQPAPLRWEQGWTQAGVEHVALAVAAGAIGLAGEFISPNRADPWSQQLGIDTAVRESLMLPTPGGRVVARRISDGLAMIVVAQPIIGDAVLNAWWGRKSPKVAWELAVIDAEVLAITAALVGTSKWYFGRERPFGRQCDLEGQDSEDCASRDRYLSFASGHTQFTFASASVTCVHHHYLPLWGNTAPWIPCATGYALAATTGALRIAADRHHFTDVLAGAMVGSLVGIVVPLLHYIDPAEATRARPSPLSMIVGMNQEGIVLRGAF